MADLKKLLIITMLSILFLGCQPFMKMVADYNSKEAREKRVLWQIEHDYMEKQKNKK